MTEVSQHGLPPLLPFAGEYANMLDSPPVGCKGKSTSLLDIVSHVFRGTKRLEGKHRHGLPQASNSTSLAHPSLSSEVHFRGTPTPR